MDILHLAKILQKSPELSSTFDYKAVVKYVELVNLLKPRLCMLLVSYQRDPPERLPVKIHEFLKHAFSMSDDVGKVAWAELGSYAWTRPFSTLEEKQAAITKHMELFLVHGLQRGIGAFIADSPMACEVVNRSYQV